MTGERGEQLEANLAACRRRIVEAAARAGRDAEQITLIVVTKYFPASDLRLLAELGVRDVGENKHQEAQAKAAELAELGLRWHFIGQLQSNKAAAVASYADVVHAVDRAKVVDRLARGANQGAQSSPERRLEALVQVSLDPPGTQGRAGVDLGDLPALAEAITSAHGLRLRGVMGVAPLDGDPAAAFAQLGVAAEQLRAVYPDATWISAGMSADLEQAVAAGATHVRVGAAVLGPRPAKR